MATNNARPQGGAGQHTNRRIGIFYDQHKSAVTPNGRPWYAWCERQADGAISPKPVGELMPDGWSAPWYPPPDVINRNIGRAVAIGSVGDVNESRFKIDYPSLIEQDRQATRTYYDLAVIAARDANLPIPDYGAPIGYRLQAIVGRAPRSPKIAEAAMAGHTWLLFGTGPVDQAMERLLAHGQVEIATARQAESKAEETESVASLKAEMEEMRTLLRAAATTAVGKRIRARHRPPPVPVVVVGSGG